MKFSIEVKLVHLDCFFSVDIWRLIYFVSSAIWALDWWLWMHLHSYCMQHTTDV